MSKRLKQAINETKEHMNLNYQSDDEDGFTDDDALDELMGECGKGPSGYCSKAGTEECEFECPFAD